MRIGLVLLLMVWACAVLAADLTKIDRRIGKEPAYQGKPYYCLLVLGPEAKQRIWLVQDGKQLFADVNGNGNLTEPGEQVQAKDADESPTFEVFVPGPDAPAKHKLSVTFWKSSKLHQEERGPFMALLTLSWTRKRTFGAWGDEQGMLFFAARPEEAPVVHIDGPLQVGFECQSALEMKARGSYELNVGVVTPGIGRGSSAHLKYWEGAVPEGMCPKAVLEFPNKTPGGPPVRVEAVLQQRC